MLFNPVHIPPPNAIIHSNIISHGHLRSIDGRSRRFSVKIFLFILPSNLRVFKVIYLSRSLAKKHKSGRTEILFFESANSVSRTLLPAIPAIRPTVGLSRKKCLRTVT